MHRKATLRIATLTCAFVLGWLIGTTTRTVEHHNYNYNYDMGEWDEVAVTPEDVGVEYLCTTEVCDDQGWVLQQADEEFECMATSIYFEAAIESYEGKLAVGEVIMNRVNNPKYPDNICDVIHQDKQFSWYQDGNSNIPNKTTQSWRDCERAAEQVMFSVTQNFPPEVDHYHADYVDPYWNEDMKQVAKIGSHIFYRL